MKLQRLFESEFKFMSGYVCCLDNRPAKIKITKKEILKIWAFRHEKEARDFFHSFDLSKIHADNLGIMIEKTVYSTLVDQYVVMIFDSSSPIENYIFFALGSSPKEIESEWEDEMLEDGFSGKIGFKDKVSYLKLDTDDSYKKYLKT